MSIYRDYCTEELRSEAAEAALLQAEAEAEAESARWEWEDEIREALISAADAEEWDLYSDLFKELYGFRPRGDAWHWYN